jgi:uncharacterized protein YdhG (YjbR/CyaY superfamily)
MYRDHADVEWASGVGLRESATGGEATDLASTPTPPGDPSRAALEPAAARGHSRAMPIDSHDAYIAAAPEQFRPLLNDLRAQLSRALPDAREVIRYDMPGFQIGEAIVAGYAAFSRQCGLYVDPGAIADHAGDIASAKLKATRTGVTFTPGRPIPGELVEKLAIGSRRMKGV